MVICIGINFDCALKLVKLDILMSLIPTLSFIKLTLAISLSKN